MSPADSLRHFRSRILWPIALALVLVPVACLIGFRQHVLADLAFGAVQTQQRVARLLDAQTEQTAAFLGGLLDLLAQDPCLRQSFAARDRARLLACAGPSLAHLGASNGIAQLAFYDAEGVNWLRVHDPSGDGDRGEHVALRQAVATEAPSHGIALGPEGALSLHVVHPWRIDGRLVGYLELGKTLDPLAPAIRNPLGIDLALLLDKRFLERDRWLAGSPDAAWERLPEQVLAGSTLTLPDTALAGAQAALASAGGGLAQIRVGERRFSVQSVPLTDAANRTVGQRLLLGDITAAVQQTDRILAWLSALALGLFVLLTGALWIYLGRIQGALGGLYDRLNAAIALQQTRERQLVEREHRLADEVADQEQFIAEEQTLGVLLRLALQETETRAYLQAALDTLLESLPWIRFQLRAGILLAEEQDGHPVLRMAVSCNLSAHRADECSAIPFGTCLCGTAAATGTIVHSDGTSRGHPLCLSDEHDHGHYSVPILSAGRCLGVLVVYLVPGHPNTETERSFLGRVADVLSIGLSRRQVAEDLRIARDAAESASRAKSEFLASMSHEIRTPMNGVLGMAELLADMPLEPEQRELVETIKKSGLALLTVINDILDFSKIEAGRLELEPIPFDLAAAVHDVTHLLSARAEQKGLELILHYRSDCPRYVIGDAGRIRQILLNLAGNAVKFTQHGHVLIDVRRLAEAGGTARIHVRIVDTGIGIAPEVIGRLFESFVQADRSTTRRFGGTGLGLAISRQLVELMGGEIGVESQPEAGSCFWFTLPLPLAQAPVAPPPPTNLSGLHAIVVEDNPVNQRIYQEQLKSFGMRTRVVENPTEALAAIRAAAAAGDPFQLGLLDHMMPDMDGEQVARQILADPEFARLPLVLLTSSGQRGDSERFSRAGFSAYLVKPVLVDTLRQCLSQLMLDAAAIPDNDAAGDSRSPPCAAAASAPEGLPRFAGRVLLAEDNAINRKVALGMLRRLGIEAEVAEDGQQAVDLCQRRAFDLILMDCQMPILDGFEATRAIRSQLDRPRPTIVALTANAMESDRERCLACGMDDYISKPFRQKDLIAAFERWLTPGE